MTKHESNKHLSENFKSALRFFTYYYFNNTLGIVSGISELNARKYHKVMKKEPSNMEMMYSIFSNNIEMNENGEVINFKHAIRRSAQFVSSCLNNSKYDYKVEPPFEDWEIELH